MDEISLDNDEVIADSEEDDASNFETAMPHDLTVSNISSFQVTNNRTVNTTISSFTDTANIKRPQDEVSLDRSRMHEHASKDVQSRPKNSNFLSSINAEMFPGPSSIADRAKMRQRNTKPSALDRSEIVSYSRETQRTNDSSIHRKDEVIELTSDEDELSFIPKDNAKSIANSKPKPKPKPKAKAATLISPNGVPTPPTASNVPAKPRPKPKPAFKRQKTPIFTPPHTSQDTNPYIGFSQRTDPVSIPFRLIPSQLPPSDPPPTSTATNLDLPTIETLPNLLTDLDAPPSSPSSLFSIPDSASHSKKRKRKTPAVDELYSDDDVRDMEPPPTFFAGSSSPTFGNGNGSQGAAGPTLQPNVIELTAAPPAKPLAVTSKKSKKPRKKGETDGNEDALKGPKTKGRQKKAATIRGNQPEVVIVIPPLPEKAKTVGKGKEVFKSKEFIDDSDDSSVQEVSKLAASARTTKSQAIENKGTSKPESMTSELSSVPDTENDIKNVALVSDNKRKSAVQTGNDVHASPTKKRKGKEWENPEDEDDAFEPRKTKPTKKRQSKGKAKAKKLILSEDEDEEAVEHDSSALASHGKIASRKTKPDEVSPEKGDNCNKDDKEAQEDTFRLGTPEPPRDDDDDEAKENMRPSYISHKVLSEKSPLVQVSRSETPSKPLFPSLSSRYTCAPKTKSTPMSELIKRVNSLPGSPFASPAPRAGSSALLKRPSVGLAYSPYLKASRSILSRIAPLHPTRRTPPPPLPPPPPKKKTKKELEMEEKWEEELVESVGGITEWACLTDDERRDMRRAKRDREMVGWED